MCSGGCPEEMPLEERWLDVCGSRGTGEAEERKGEERREVIVVLL